MATRRRNAKTHPKPTGDDGLQDDFMPLDRPDRDTGEDAGRTEVVDVFAKETGQVGGTDEGTVDLNSATEGDARGMASEGAGDDNGAGGAEDAADTRVGTRRIPRDRAAAANTAATDDEPAEFGARVRKRIARERALVNRERALREQTQRELAEERTARQAQDERIARLERQQTEVTGNAGVKDLEAQIAALKPLLAAAMEAGETAKALDLQDKLADLRGKIEVLKYDLRQKQAAADTAAANRGTSTARQADTTSVVDDPRVAELAESFRKANRHWWNRSANKDARADAITIDKEILIEIQAGDLDFEPYTDEHFEEVARRLHETYPDLEIQDLDGQPYEFTDEDDMSAGNPNKGRQQQGGGPRQGGRGAAPIARRGDNGRRGPNEQELARQGKVTLDEADYKTMRLFKMDPNNAKDKKYFAKEKMRSILSGQRQSGGAR